MKTSSFETLAEFVVIKVYPLPYLNGQLETKCFDHNRKRLHLSDCLKLC